MNIRQHILKAINSGMPARFAVRGTVSGVQFLADDATFIGFDDLGYHPTYGYFRLSAFPNTTSECVGSLTPLSQRTPAAIRTDDADFVEKR